MCAALFVFPLSLGYSLTHCLATMKTKYLSLSFLSLGYSSTHCLATMKKKYLSLSFLSLGCSLTLRETYEAWY